MSEITITQEAVGQAIGLLFQFDKRVPFDEARKCLKEDLARMAKEIRKTVEGAPFLHISMPCGESVSYQEYEDIPMTDIPCTCGNPKHWFIKYVAHETGVTNV